MWTAQDLIDRDRYPIHQNGPARDALLSKVRADLAQDGCAVIKGFLTPAGVAALAEEAEGVADKGHRSYNRTNAYFTADDPSLPEDDPRRRFFDRSNAFIPADNSPDRGRCAPSMTATGSMISSAIAFRRTGSTATPTRWPMSS